MKRALILLLVLALFSGCGSSPEDSTSLPPDVQEEIGENPSQSKHIKMLDYKLPETVTVSYYTDYENIHHGSVSDIATVLYADPTVLLRNTRDDLKVIRIISYRDGAIISDKETEILPGEQNFYPSFTVEYLPGESQTVGFVVMEHGDDIGEWLEVGSAESTVTVPVPPTVQFTEENVKTELRDEKLSIELRGLSSEEFLLNPEQKTVISSAGTTFLMPDGFVEEIRFRSESTWKGMVPEEHERLVDWFPPEHFTFHEGTGLLYSGLIVFTKVTYDGLLHLKEKMDSDEVDISDMPTAFGFTKSLFPEVTSEKCILDDNCYRVDFGVPSLLSELPVEIELRVTGDNFSPSRVRIECTITGETDHYVASKDVMCSDVSVDRF